MDSTLIGIILVIFVLVAIFLSRKRGGLFSEDAMRNERLANAGKPSLWLFYDLSEVNARWWMDFMGRSSRAINLPYLNLCYQSIVKHGAGQYNIKVLSGLEDVSLLLGGWEALPSTMRDRRAPLGRAEKAWIRAAVLEKQGGMWLEPSTIVMSQLPLPEGNKLVFYGTDSDEMYTRQGTMAAPSFNAVFSPRAGHPAMKEMLELASSERRLFGGGKEMRKDDIWDWVAACAGKQMCEVGKGLTLDRKANGKRIEVEDLLATVDGIPSPFHVPANTIFVPLPSREFLDFRNFGWFLRMSEEQILESPLAVSALFKKALGM
jgi:hypothetical protein